MTTTFDGDALQSIVASHTKTLSQVTVKAVGSQMALMTVISVSPISQGGIIADDQVLTVAAFSFFRRREKKVYAPKVNSPLYQLGFS
jgi:hypothetical protein